MPYIYNPLTSQFDYYQEVRDEPYGPEWSGDISKAASRNALYDKLRSVDDAVAALIVDEPYGPEWSGDISKAASRNALYDKLRSVDDAVAALIVDEPYGGDWSGDTVRGASRNALYDKFESIFSLSPVTLIVAASNSLFPSRADYQCDGVTDESEINTAIARVVAAGGGKVVLLDGTYNTDSAIGILGSYVSLEGQGEGTLLYRSTTGAKCNIIVVSNGATACPGVAIRNLKIDGRSSTYTDKGVYVWGATGAQCDRFVLNNVFISRCTTGAYVERAYYSTIQNCHFTEGSTGLYASSLDYSLIQGNFITSTTFTGMSLNGVYRGRVVGNVFYNCSGSYGAIYDNAPEVIFSGNAFYNCSQGIQGAASSYCTITGNFFRNCSGHHIYLPLMTESVEITGNTFWAGGNAIGLRKVSKVAITGNNFAYLTGAPLSLTEASSSVSLIGNTFYFGNLPALSGTLLYSSIIGNTFDRIGIAAGRGTIELASAIGNTIQGNTFSYSSPYYIKLDASCVRNVIQGNSFCSAASIAPIQDLGSSNSCLNNTGYIPSIQNQAHFLYMKNTSGGQLVAGDVVVLKAAAGGDEFTTTVNQGDDMVGGMVAETIADAAYGMVQVLGKTTALKVNGTIDIAIGDLLGTFTTAGIAMKAAAGDMAFAIALEAYATDDSNGVIDALLITPRKV